MLRLRPSGGARGTERGTGRLEQAVAAYREALKERIRERAPLDWARTQNNLGDTLSRLGGTANLEEAVAAYREALKELTRERVPLQWAGVQHRLAFALESLWDRQSGTAKLEEAVAAYREALKERTRDRVPLDWSWTQHNLGNVLRALGTRESGTAKLEEAAAAYREALKGWTLEVAPRDWSFSNLQLGDCLALIADRSGDLSRASEAVEVLAQTRNVIDRLSDEAIRLRLEGSLHSAYFSRGRLLLYNGSLAEARSDFKQVTELAPSDAYSVLWLDIAERRNNFPSSLPQAVAKVDMKAWPAPLLRLFLGQITPAAVLGAADDLDPIKKREQVCEANFYRGQLALINDARDEATRLFQVAANECPDYFIELEGAKAELRALSAR